MHAISRALFAPLIVVCLVVFCQPVAAEEAAASSTPTAFSKLEGHWEGSGTLLGRPASFTMQWDTTPAGFARLTFSNAWVGEDGSRTPVLSSEATYLPRGDSAVGVWLDSRPQRVMLSAALTDSSVTSNWTADAEEGRTEYVVRSSEEVVVRDYVMANGSERLFGEATYRRVSAPSERP